MNRRWLLIFSCLTVLESIQCDIKIFKKITITEYGGNINNEAASTTPFCPIQQECTPENVMENIPLVEDCTKYMHCGASGNVTIDCPVGQEFNPTNLTCMDPALAGCPKCPGGTTVTDEITTRTQVMTTPHCIQQAECVSPDDDYNTIPYAANCTQYVYCEPGNVSLIMDCPDGLHYSPTAHTCAEPELAGCPQCIITTTLPPTSPYCPVQSSCTPELETYTIPYVEDCTKYIYCQLDGSETLMSCPNTLHYSPTVHTCMDADISGCPRCSDAINSSTTETSVTGTGTGGYTQTVPYCPNQQSCTIDLAGQSLPYIVDCTHYLYCLADGTGELRTCPDIEQFSPYELTCMAPELARCPKC